MKTKDIAYGGLMIAAFLVLSFIFRANIRSLQTYLEIIKTIVVAALIRNIHKEARWIFALACFAGCMLFESVTNNLIYNVPCIVGGWVIGQQQDSSKRVRNYISYFIVHSVMMIYEFAMFSAIMQIDLVNLYREQFSDILSIITSGSIPKPFLETLFILFTAFDSVFSSFVIFSLTQAALKKLSKTKGTT